MPMTDTTDLQKEISNLSFKLVEAGCSLEAVGQELLMAGIGMMTKARGGVYTAERLNTAAQKLFSMSINASGRFPRNQGAS